MFQHNVSDASILITGGTGSFGKSFVRRVLSDFPQVRRLIVYSRDELKQFEMQQEYPIADYPNLRFFIGDVRDGQRLERAMEDVDYVVHAAALKQVPTAEYNPFECIKTNVLGAENVVSAALQHRVKKLWRSPPIRHARRSICTVPPSSARTRCFWPPTTCAVNGRQRFPWSATETSWVREDPSFLSF